MKVNITQEDFEDALFLYLTKFAGWERHIALMAQQLIPPLASAENLMKDRPLIALLAFMKTALDTEAEAHNLWAHLSDDAKEELLKNIGGDKSVKSTD